MLSAEMLLLFQSAELPVVLPRGAAAAYSRSAIYTATAAACEATSTAVSVAEVL